MPSPATFSVDMSGMVYGIWMYIGLAPAREALLTGASARLHHLQRYYSGLVIDHSCVATGSLEEGGCAASGVQGVSTNLCVRVAEV